MGLKLDVSQYGEFEQLPPGHYHVAVTGVEERETSDSSKYPKNPFWNVEMTVQSGDYEGRKEWSNLMLPPYDPIELGRMVKVCPKFKEADLTDLDLDEDGTDLLDEEFIIRVGPQKKNPEYNEVKKYYTLEDNEELLEGGDDLDP